MLEPERSHQLHISLHISSVGPYSRTCWVFVSVVTTFSTHFSLSLTRSESSSTLFTTLLRSHLLRFAHFLLSVHWRIPNFGHLSLHNGRCETRNGTTGAYDVCLVTTANFEIPVSIVIMANSSSLLDSIDTMCHTVHMFLMITISCDASVRVVQRSRNATEPPLCIWRQRAHLSSCFTESCLLHVIYPSRSDELDNACVANEKSRPRLLSGVVTHVLNLSRNNAQTACFAQREHLAEYWMLIVFLGNRQETSL